MARRLLRCVPHGGDASPQSRGSLSGRRVGEPSGKPPTHVRAAEGQTTAKCFREEIAARTDLEHNDAIVVESRTETSKVARRRQIEARADDGSTCRYCPAGCVQSSGSAVYRFLYRV